MDRGEDVERTLQDKDRGAVFVVRSLMSELGLGLAEPTIDVSETITPATMLALGMRRGEQEDGIAHARGDEATGPLPRIAMADGGEGPCVETERDGSSIEDADYVVKGVLGEGGMGRVLVARQRSLGRDVAIKILRDGGEASRGGDMLLAEGLVTGSLQHPSIVPVHALGADANGRPVLVMKRIEGVAWSTLLKDPLHEAWSHIVPDPAERLAANIDILMRVCDGVHYAHSRGVIHRDIKPSNVMVGGYGEVYVMDWGVAMRMSRRSSMNALDLTGTPSYMAPEMAAGTTARIDERTDVFLIGATLHVILTGRSRHSAEGLGNVLMQAVASTPATYGPDVPSELGAICNRACAADPRRRFESALALRRALADFLRHRSSVALCQRLAPRTDELARLVLDGTRSDPESKALGLLSESRFGYEQALREWPSNPVAREGLRQTLASAVRLELAQGDAVGARAALRELEELGNGGSERTAVAVPRLEALVAHAERHARTRDETLERLERDADLRVGAWQRGVVIVLLLPFAAGMAGFVALGGAKAITRANMVEVIVLMNVVLWIAVGVGRRKLLETAVNRRIIAGASVMLAVWLANRLVGWAAHTPLNIIGATDLFVLAAIAGAAWAPQLRRFILVSIITLGAGIGAMHVAEYWAPLFAIASIIALGTFASLFVGGQPWASLAAPVPGPRGTPPTPTPVPTLSTSVH